MWHAERFTMRIALIIFLLVLALVAGLAIYMRAVAMPAAIWHVDPDTAVAPTTPNFVLINGDEAPVVSLSPTDTATRLDAIARDDGASLIGGSLTDGFATYLVRTRLMGFPDVVSIRLHDDGGQTRISLFSRSRFGESDMGVNQARVDRWLGALTP